MNKKKRKPGQTDPATTPANSGKSKNAPSSTGPRQLSGMEILMSRWKLLLVFLVISVGGSFAWYYLTKDLGIQMYTYEVIQEYPHDVGDFTQGLVFDSGFLFESTGQYGESKLKKTDLASGRETKRIDLDKKYFGEGLTLFQDRLYQLTWQEQTVLVYNRDLELVQTMQYEGDGWGLTHDGRNLIFSNGTPTIRFYDPKTFELVRKISVRKGGSLLWKINELEYVGGLIYANVHDRDFIVQIDPDSGEVVGQIDLRGLKPKDIEVGVLNGIAFNTTTKKLIVTGKNWPKMYEIEIKRAPR